MVLVRDGGQIEFMPRGGLPVELVGGGCRVELGHWTLVIVREGEPSGRIAVKDARFGPGLAARGTRPPHHLRRRSCGGRKLLLRERRAALLMPEAAALRLLTLKLLLTAAASNSLLLLTAAAVHGVGEARAHLRFPLLRLFLLHLRVLTVALDGADIPHLGLRCSGRVVALAQTRDELVAADRLNLTFGDARRLLEGRRSLCGRSFGA